VIPSLNSESLPTRFEGVGQSVQNGGTELLAALCRLDVTLHDQGMSSLQGDARKAGHGID